MTNFTVNLMVGKSDATCAVQLYDYEHHSKIVYFILLAPACNKYMTSQNGTIESPLVPLGYNGPGVECSWTLQGGKWQESA